MHRETPHDIPHQIPARQELRAGAVPREQRLANRLDHGLDKGPGQASRLRLVGGESASPEARFLADTRIRSPRSHATAQRDVARANIEAAHDRTLDPRDPRLLVALEASRHLEGPLMTFERRRKVLAFAARLGVRPFDTHLIIAAVQDRARRGEPLAMALPLVAMTARPQTTTAPDAASVADAPGVATDPATIDSDSVRSFATRVMRAAWPYLFAAAIAALAHALLGYWLLGRSAP